MAANPPPGRVLVAITCWEGTDPYPTDQPLVEDGGIVTFASDFLGGFDPAGPHGGLAQGVRADVNWLRAWELPAEVFYGSSLGFLRPFTCACTMPHVTVPTAAQVVADLHKPNFQTNAPGVQLDSVSLPWRQPPLNQTGVDQIHTDEAQNYMFCQDGEEEELEDDMAPMTEQKKAEAIVSMVRSRAAYVILEVHASL